MLLCSKKFPKSVWLKILGIVTKWPVKPIWARGQISIASILLIGFIGIIPLQESNHFFLFERKHEGLLYSWAMKNTPIPSHYTGRLKAIPAIKYSPNKQGSVSSATLEINESTWTTKAILNSWVANYFPWFLWPVFCRNHDAWNKPGHPTAVSCWYICISDLYL